MQEKAVYHAFLKISSIKRIIIKSSEKKTNLGYISTGNEYWVTTAPEGWEYDFKEKACRKKKCSNIS